MDKLRIVIPPYYNDDESLKDWIANNVEEFWPAMDLDASRYDDRASLDDVNITGIVITNTTVEIQYEYEYSAYYGCRDMNYTEIAPEDTIVGERLGNVLTFDKSIPYERPSTHDEL